MIEWLWFGLLLPAHLYISAVGQLSWIVSHFDDGSPIPLNYVAVSGPRYTSSKIDLPSTTVSAWWYGGDEPAWGDCRPTGADPVDESTWAHRVDHRPTTSMRGDETR